MSTSPTTAAKPIRVGLIGAGTWAEMAHIPMLKLIPGYELSAVYARRPETAQRVAEQFGFRHVASSVSDLVNNPEVDFVVVATTAPQHAEDVRAAIAAGKDVYSEWPLTTTTEIAQDLAERAKAAGVRHVVGLQRRLAPHNRYLADLIQEGFVGAIRSVRVHVSIPYLGERRASRASWTLPVENFSNVVTIYAGHFLDMVFTATGWPSDIAALELNQFPEAIVEETGERVTNTSLEQLVAFGRLGERGVVSIQIEGGKLHGSGVQIDITGDQGDLRITNTNAFGDDDYQIIGAKAADAAMLPMAVPASYNRIPPSELASSVLELGQLYAAFAEGQQSGTTTTPTFEDALRLHRMFDALTASTSAQSRIALDPPATSA